MALKEGGRGGRTGEFLLHLESAVRETESAGAGSSGCELGGELVRRDPRVRNLIRTLDAILCHRLGDVDRAFWPAVSEFLSRQQIQEIRLRWEPRSPRATSLAWIFYSLNHGDLEFHFLAFKQHPAFLRRFYSQSAFLLNPDALARASTILAALHGLPFNLKPVLFPLRTAESRTRIAVKFGPLLSLDVLSLCAWHYRRCGKAAKATVSSQSPSFAQPLLLKPSWRLA